MADLLLRAGFWVPLALCTYLALAPAPPHSVFQISDVVQHAFAFVFLLLAVRLAYPRLSAVQAFVLLLAYGIALEGLQSFFPPREPSLGDLAVDVAGLLAGLGLWRILGEPTRALLRRICARLGWTSRLLSVN